MHAKSGLRVVLEWKVYRPDSVIAAVIWLIGKLRIMTIGLRTFLVVVIAASLLAIFSVEHFGWIHPPRKIRSIISRIEAMQEPIGYNQFVDTLHLPEGSPAPPMGGVYGGSYHWDFTHGYRMDTQFDYRGDGHLQYVVIYSESDDHIRFAWQWANGETIPLDEFWSNAIAR